MDYGQWGLRFLPPGESVTRTNAERAARHEDYRPGDVVIAEFIGDQELLVLTGQQGAVEAGILVALPLDSRELWPRVAGDLTEFLARYLTGVGEKYWEP